MNISKPVSDSISSVDFTFLSSEDIKALSVKRIQCPTTFDNLLHPIPGGLYDTALGAWGDTPCATCHLNAFTCPGHPGHIELPVPVYHVTVFAQAYRLLGAKCCYCHNLRMSRVDVNRFVCKLRLVRHGLLPEVDMLDDLRRERDSSGQDDDKKGEESDESEDDATVMRRRAVFVSRAIRFTGSTFRRNAWINERNQAMLEKRRAIIRELMRSMNKGKRCHNCGGLSPRYRKDKFVKIFQRPLAAKDFDRMAKGGFELNSAMVLLNQQRQALAKRKSRGYEVDEGIVADVEEEEDGHREEDESSSSDTETSTDEDGNQVKDTAKLPEKKSRYSAAQRFVDAGEVHAALTLLFEKERELFNLVYDARPRSATQPPVTADVFFIRRLLVPPSRYRPEAHTGDGEIAEAQQNELYKAIMRQCATIHDIHREIKMRQTGDGVNEPGKRQRDVSDIRDVWIRLQEAVNSLLDRDRNPIQGIAARHTEDGIKQLLERKDGLFRKNMMGKRVNFAARSVISPDPNIETNEVGVPLVFAKKLTYPEPVTNHNFYEMKNAVLNGAVKWPGAMAIENENGQVVSLRNKNFEERQALANQLLAPSSNTVVGARNKKVHRHLNNGDIVLMNRQPTLHKPSIMGHRARVLPGEKTIRMHYANCNTYNADFDGDEMNMHFPQNEIARAEALQVADADHQYLVATSGKPLRGLIQDHLSMGVWLSNKDTFFDKHHYQQLLYSCLRPEENHTTSDRILTVPPAIIRPRPLWTGKQVVSTVLENIRPVAHPGLTLTSKSSTPGDRWHHVSEEGTVLFKDGELLCGVLDKSQLGPTVGGMIHSVYEVYGHSVAGKLLGIIGRLLTKLLHMRAFSCGVEDLILRKDGDAARREKLRSAKGIGLEVAAKYVTLEDQNVKDDNEELRSRLEDVFRSEEKRVGLDSVVNSRTQVLSSDITRECLPAGLAKQFPQNQMQTMTTSGAKGTIVNANLISCNLGQQILEGRRVPMMISGKTLPSFKPFDTDVRAGGYITDRFLTGIRPQEYYFHCMAGREGLIDTAVKTSRSGYLQRCLVKGLEGLKVEYDNSVRDTDGSVVQFLYGEDGLDITKQKHLMDFKFVAENFLSLFAQLNVREDLPHMLRDGAREWRKKSMKAVRRTGRIDAMDPVLAHFSPSRYMHSTSETFANALAEYQKSNPDGILQDTKKGIKGLVSKKNFELLMDLKYLKAIIEPGEAVGIVAGQSIGEPSTQMTLNTFHLAGHAAKNVTLGIPRLREIVMTASTKISTPVMTLYLRPELTEQDRERFAKAISRLSLAEIIENVTVNERIGSGTTYATARIYDIRIDFYPADEYCHEYALSTRDVGSALEQKLAPRLQKVIRAELKRRGANRMWTGATASSALPEVGESAGRIEKAAPSRRNVEGGEEGGDEDEDGDDDDDDDAANAKANRANDVAYDDGDDDDDNGDDDDRTAVRDPGASPSNADMTDEGIGSSPEPEGDEDDTDATPAKEFTRTRADRVKAFCKDITHFRFDEDEGQCCEMRVEYPAETPKILALNLVESSCRSVVLHAIPGIKSCTVSTEKKRDAKSNVEVEEAVVLTAGVNIVAMQEHPEELDPNRIMTNDIAGMLRHYGVEACRASIMREMDSVFKGHGITVDLRHLNLIADAMTRGGGFRPFSRIGLNANTSPFLKMSFETTTAFLRDAALEGDRDDLVSPSARLVLGKIGRAGTGAFDVLMPLYQSEDDDRGDDCGDLNGGGADVVGDDNGLDLV